MYNIRRYRDTRFVGVYLGDRLGECRQTGRVVGGWSQYELAIFFQYVF